MRLSREEKKPELLRDAAKRSGKNDFRAISEYLLGERPRASFEESLRGITTKHIQCAVNFIAWWHASLDKKPSLSETHVKAMSALGDEPCRIELGLVNLRK